MQNKHTFETGYNMQHAYVHLNTVRYLTTHAMTKLQQFAGLSKQQKESAKDTSTAPQQYMSVSFDKE